MLQQVFVILLLSLALSGCMDDAPESAGKTKNQVTYEEPDSPPSNSRIDLGFTLENETKIIRFKTDHEDGITIQAPPAPEPLAPMETGEDWIVAVFILGGGMLHRTSAMYDYHIRANDQTVTLLPDGGTQVSYGWNAPGPNVPGDHVVAFHAENTNATFRATSENATYQILENETMDFRYITQDHPDWDRELHIEAPQVQHFDGTIEIEPTGNALDISGTVWGENRKTRIDRGEGRSPCMGEGVPLGAHTDQTTTVSVETTQFGLVHPVNLWIADWSLEQKNNMCWEDHFSDN